MGVCFFGSAAQSQLKKLDVIQAQALRLCCGAFKLTPLSALQVEMGEFPLELRRKQLMVNYWAGLQGHTNSHPTKVMLQDSWEYGKRLSENFGRIVNDTAKELGVNPFTSVLLIDTLMSICACFKARPANL